MTGSSAQSSHTDQLLNHRRCTAFRSLKFTTHTALKKCMIFHVWFIRNIYWDWHIFDCTRHRAFKQYLISHDRFISTMQSDLSVLWPHETHSLQTIPHPPQPVHQHYPLRLSNLWAAQETQPSNNIWFISKIQPDWNLICFWDYARHTAFKQYLIWHDWLISIGQSDWPVSGFYKTHSA